MVKLGDGIVQMARLRRGSVGLVFADLPSGQTRAEFDVPVDLPEFWQSAWRCLKPGRVVVVMASSFRFACKVVESQPNYFRYDLIWHKSLVTGVLNAKKRPLRTHEFVLVFSRSGELYTPQMTQGASPIHACRRVTHSENYGKFGESTVARAGATDRYPTSVISCRSVGTTSPDRVHPQQKPVGLLCWVIETFTRPGELVVDPCAGSGSAEVAAGSVGRRFLGWDISPRFGSKE